MPYIVIDPPARDLTTQGKPYYSFMEWHRRQCKRCGARFMSRRSRTTTTSKYCPDCQMDLYVENHSLDDYPCQPER